MTTWGELTTPSPRPWKPDADQRKAVKWLLEHGAAGLIADPGVGKTSCSLKAIQILKEDLGIFTRALVLKPMRVTAWQDELHEWADFHNLTYDVLHGPNKLERALDRKSDIHIINPEGLDWLFGVGHSRSPMGRKRVEIDMKRFRALGYCTLIIDELGKFKHGSSYRSKTLKKVVPYFRRRWGLTGNLSPNGYEDLHGQCFMLDLGRSLGAYITAYRRLYFIPNSYTFKWTLREEAKPEIHKRIAPLMLRLEAKGLPPLREVDVKVELPPAARKIYDELEADMISRLGSKTFVAANSAAVSVKCRQVAAGGLYPEIDGDADLEEFPKRGKRQAVHLHDAKTDALEDLLGSLGGEPMWCAYWWRHDLERIRARLGKEYHFEGDLPYIGGGVTPKRASALQNAWNAGKLPFMLGHPMSVAHGLNMQGSSAGHVGFYSMTYDFDLYDQFIRRLLRRNTGAKSVIAHRFVAIDTVDEAMCWSVRAKGIGQNGLYDALMKLAKRRKR